MFHFYTPWKHGMHPPSTFFLGGVGVKILEKYLLRGRGEVRSFYFGGGGCIVEGGVILLGGGGGGVTEFWGKI